jgi:hypothetical protein
VIGRYAVQGVVAGYFVRPRHRVSVVTAVLGASAAFWAVPATAQTAGADDSLSQYEAVLQDPNGVASNLSYAASLQTAGQNGEAQQVYQKVLSLDPNNATARAALPSLSTGGGPIATLGAAPAASGAQTDYWLRFGIGYESNSARLPPVYPHGYPDAVGFGEFTVNDTRQIGSVTLQSNFDIYSNAHARYLLGDLSYVTLDTGPLFDLGDNGKLRVAVGTEYVLQGQSSITNTDVIREFEFNAGNMIFNWFPARAQALQSVNLLVGYDNFRKSDDYRSGVVMHATAPFVFNDLPAVTHTQVIVTPGFVYNGANQPNVVPPLEPAHYAEGDLDVLTLTPIAEHVLGAERVLGKLGIFADTQYYDSHDPIPTNDRQDIQLIPVAGVRLVGFLWPRVQLDLDYRYDRNFSNDAAQRFADHIVSLIATLRF